MTQAMARCHVCFPSWSPMHDECVICAKKYAVAMGTNVLIYLASRSDWLYLLAD